MAFLPSSLHRAFQKLRKLGIKKRFLSVQDWFLCIPNPKRVVSLVIGSYPPVSYDGKPRAMAITCVVWGTSEPLWPATCKEGIHVWHPDFYLKHVRRWRGLGFSWLTRRRKPWEGRANMCWAYWKQQKLMCPALLPLRIYSLHSMSEPAMNQTQETRNVFLILKIQEGNAEVRTN